MTRERRIRPLGRAGHLIECEGLDDAVAVRDALRAPGGPLAGRMAECVLGARTVVVRGVGITARDLDEALAAAPVGASVGAAGHREHTIDVEYSGADLDALATRLDVSSEALVTRHSSTTWTAAFGGFAPGFFYCLPAGGSPLPPVPRLDEPRQHVPPGSVALAGRFSAVYPHSSPGGWQLIGHTDATLFDLDRDPPALLEPGDRIRYRPSREALPEIRDPGDAGAPGDAGGPGGWGGADGPDTSDREHAERRDAGAPGSSHTLVVRATGPGALIEDRGRAGFADVGVPRSGVADRRSAAAANELVGNGPDAAVLEVLLGGLAVVANGAAVVALTGAALDSSVTPTTADEPGAPATDPGADPDDSSAGVAAPFGRAFVLPDGHELRLGLPRAGLRTYLAVRGGFDSPVVLGSRSTDTLTGIGPGVLTVGRVLGIGTAPSTATGVSPVAGHTHLAPDVLTLRVVLGPRDKWVDRASVARFLDLDWTVGARSDRVGVRLDGPPLSRVSDEELPSEGVVPGAVQITGSGMPVVFLRDHPVTGGYPVIACVVDADLDLLAQARPGQRVRFAA